MEKTDLENLNIRESNGGKRDTNLSALADSMRFLSLGMPNVSRSKKFNVNAWSTPLKSIENQQRRAARQKVYEIESVASAAVATAAADDDDSLSNLSDLFPGHNVFEKTSDLIEYYGVNSAAVSECTPIGDRAASSAPVRPTRSPIESTVADLGVSISYSPRGVGRGHCPTASSSSPGYGQSPRRNGCDISEPPTDDEDDDASSCDSASSDDHFYLAVGHVGDASVDSTSADGGALDSAAEQSVVELRGSGAASDGVVGRGEKGVEAVFESGDGTGGAAAAVDDGSPCPVSEEAGRQPSITDAGLPEADDERVTVLGSPWSTPPAKPEATNRSPTPPPVSCASHHSSDPSRHLAVEVRSRTPRSQCSDDGRSFLDHFHRLAGSPNTEVNERFVEYEVKNDSDSQITALESTIDVSSSAEKPPSENDSRLTKFSSISPSNSRDRACLDIESERPEVCLKADNFFNVAIDAISTDETTSLRQFEKPNSTLKTPIERVDQGQNLQSDKLARVCDSMNKLMSLCTPMKDLRTHSRNPSNPFRCENVGTDCKKIVFDLPTSLLDISIDMLESMTAMIAPVKSSNVTHTDERNIASDLISVAQTPKIIRIQSDQSSYLSQPNVSDINKRLLKENENLKTELEDYKGKYNVLQGEYESLLKTASAVRANETTLKKALQEYEDETRKACNKYYLIKEYADILIISLNRSLDHCEKELKIKTEELQKLKGSL